MLWQKLFTMTHVYLSTGKAQLQTWKKNVLGVQSNGKYDYIHLINVNFITRWNVMLNSRQAHILWQNYQYTVGKAPLQIRNLLFCTLLFFSIYFVITTLPYSNKTSISELELSCLVVNHRGINTNYFRHTNDITFHIHESFYMHIVYIDLNRLIFYCTECCSAFLSLRKKEVDRVNNVINTCFYIFTYFN